MFEVFGPFARPSPSPWAACLAAWPVVVAVAIALAGRQRVRVFAFWGAMLGAAGAAAAMAFLLTRAPDARVLLSSLGVAARVGQLDLTLALALDPGSALLAAAAFLATAAVARRSASPLASFGARRRASLLLLTLAATLVAILGDGAAPLVVGGALASFGAASLGRPSAEGFVADRVADLALAGAACVAFWAFGGSWIDGQYVPDLQPRLVIAREAESARPSADVGGEDEDDRPVARGSQSPGSLSLGSLPGAALMVDGTWLREGDSLLRAPFGPAPVPAGPHTLRVHVGAGSDDYYIPRVQIGAGERLAVAVQGSTATFREMSDQIEARAASGADVTRAALSRRTIAPGVSAAGVVVVLVLVAFAARGRLLPFHAPDGERRLPFAALVGLAATWRFGLLAPLAPATASAAACALFTAAAVAALTAIRRGRARDVLGAELAFAAAGAFVSAPAAALLHGAIAGVVATARGGGPVPRASHLALFFTRASILGACGALPHASAIVVALGLAAALALSSVTSAASPSWGWAAAAAVALLAVDPRSFRHAHSSIADAALGKSLLPASLALIALLGAVVAAGVASSARTAARLRAVPPSSHAAAPSRVTGAIVLSASAAVTELDARLLDGLLQLGEGVLRAAGWLFARLDDVVLSRTAAAAPLPSERAARAVLLGLALLALATFALPWLA